MPDADLAELYGVETKTLNRAIKRNIERFPIDFMFQLTTEEFANLKYQFGTSSWGGRRTLPFAFTEHGAIMAATVLNSPRAVQMSVFVVRAFVRLRELLSTNRELSEKIADLEGRVDTHDDAIREIISAIKQLTQPPQTQRKQIGFRAVEESKKALRAHAR